MSDFPYTDEQVREFSMVAWPRGGETFEGATRQILQRAHEAGFTIEFPLPDYEVVRYTVSGYGGWAVRDTAEYRLKAWYGEDPLNAEKDARELCARLNAEARG